MCLIVGLTVKMQEIADKAEILLNEVREFIEIAENELMPVDIDYLNGIEKRIRRIINNPK